MELHELAWAGGERPLPATVELAGCAGSPVHLRVHRWLHATPARHDVLARWDDRYVLARLLTGPDAGMDLEREKAGVRQLAAQELPTLTLLREGRTPELDAWLLYEADDDVQRLDAVWENLASQAPLTEAQQTLFGEALCALGALHGKGLWPTDPSLRRFIRHRERIHLLDAGTLRSETPGSPLGRDQVLANLGQFFAQFPTRFEPWFEELLVFYLLVNGEHALPLEALLKEAAKAREQNMRRQLTRLERNSPVCALARRGGMLRAVLRSEQARLRTIVADPEAVMRSGAPSAAGGEADAALLETPAGPVRLIRYPAPTGWRRLLTSPAWRAWIAGQRGYLLGETDRRPLAVVERRRLGLRGVSYLITEANDAEERG
ncbi:MAG TPA: serine/threonine protein kinase [Pseudomonas sp.]|nr:serine/threonine protein kinase [Pseudomonas sp.]